MWYSDISIKVIDKSILLYMCFFFSSRRRHTICLSDWSSDVCSSDLNTALAIEERSPRDSSMMLQLPPCRIANPSSVGTRSEPSGPSDKAPQYMLGAMWAVSGENRAEADA